MIKDYLREHQPVFYRLLENEFSKNRVPHAFLLTGNNTEKPLQFLAMSLICDNTLACEECIDCQKVFHNKYGDLIVLDGQETSIKKSDIERIQDTFKKTSLEGKAKVYIIKNIEYSSPGAMNALLKILEEPIPGIYSVFTTQNTNKVLPTILSRCQVIDIKPDSKDVFVHDLINEGVTEEHANVLSELVTDKKLALEINDDKFEYMILQTINFIEDLFTQRENLIINTQTHILKTYKDKDDIKMFLNLILIALKDMFHVKHSQPIHFVDHLDFFKSLHFENDDIIKMMEKVLETIYLIDSNANVLLLMDSLMYRL